jgi:hypothetical protein
MGRTIKISKPQKKYCLHKPENTLTGCLTPKASSKRGRFFLKKTDVPYGIGGRAASWYKKTI